MTPRNLSIAPGVLPAMPAVVCVGLSAVSALAGSPSAQPELIAKLATGAVHDSFGQSLASVGDFNGDGFDDIAVGAPGGLGQVFVYFGGPASDTAADVVLVPGVPNNGYAFGVSVAGIGDFNDDGYDDIAVGEPYGDPFAYYTGIVFLFYGDASPDGDWDVRWFAQTDDQFGLTVAGPGDVNGDGFSDLFVGGRDGAVLALGPASDALPVVALTMQTVPDNYRVTGSVSGAGDLNGDGYADLAAGVVVNEIGSLVFVYFGSATPDADVDLVLFPTLPAGGFGDVMSPVGDLNGDGFGDLVVGDHYSEQRVYVFFGGEFPSPYPGLIIEDSSSTYRFGSSVSGLGDVNGDGFSDIAIGDPFVDEYEGRCYVVLGGDAMSGVPDFFLREPTARRRSEFGVVVGRAGDFNADGLPDLLVATWKQSVPQAVYVFDLSSVTTGVPDALEASLADDLRVDPQPASGSSVSITVRSLPPEEMSSRAIVTVVDVGGSVVARMETDGAELVSRGISWNRTDSIGRTLPAGVYFVAVSCGRTFASGKIVLVD